MDETSDTEANKSEFPIIPLAVGVVVLLVLVLAIKAKSSKKKTTHEKDAEDN